MPKKFNQHVLEFFSSLKIETKLPKKIEILNPYKDPATFDLCKKFYHQYYNDSNQRAIIIGINPGRLGAGLTGIPFTDPINLEKNCSIENPFPKKPELSSTFIYEMIDAYGGSGKFYSKYYFSSVSPLGFIREGKNINYYDEPTLESKLKTFILSCIKEQLSFGIKTDKAFCLGEGLNYKYLNALNIEHKLFDEIIPLAHPRFIMQYKRKTKTQYIDHYLEVLK